MTFTPSPHQQAIFNFVASGTGSALINAVAGSGKSTTIKQSLRYIDSRATVLMLAFNKSIAAELDQDIALMVGRGDVTCRVQARTFHSVGSRAWGRHVGSYTVRDEKVFQIIRDTLSPNDMKKYAACVRSLVSQAKSAGMGYIIEDKFESWEAIADHHDIGPEQGSLDVAINHARHVLRRSNEMRNIIDFNDMLYLPLIEDAPFYRFDYVFGDETQDTNEVQIELLRRMLNPRGRFIGVGDRAQAIYGFRGADSKSMDKIAEAFGCTELPLSISYRCARAVVARAKQIVPQIEPSDTASEGEVLDFAQLDPRVLEPTAAILCRNVKPLVSAAYKLISMGRPARIVGRDIGTGLIKLIEKMGATDIDGLVWALHIYEQLEVLKALGKGQEAKAASIEDRVETVLVLINGLPETARTIASLVDKIASLFSDTARENTITLSTVHKSKGLEWSKVYVIETQLMPSSWARREWQREQEQNLIYVAYTRAKNSLVLIESGFVSDDEIKEAAE